MTVIWTADETEQLILMALEARDFEDVVSLLRYLATVDGGRASEIYDTMLLALHLARVR